MSLTGLGVLLIGAGFLVLAIYIGRVLNGIAGTLGGVNKTLDQLPEQLDGVLGETGQLIRHSNDTLADVNTKLGNLTPLFQVAGDLGNTTRNLTASLQNVTESAKRKVEGADEAKRSKSIGGIYGTAALGYYAVRKGKALKQPESYPRPGTMAEAGQKRSADIDRMKAQAAAAVNEKK
ncbi:hypothetical protein NCCP2716_07040 [Sporosarcina sp. NCCP-2716]|uniref:DUF948 domain-containing protein n=1 Tax=Sporosarcina sp. NCCP-2716 TaxID=2943679 RepID=UPI00203B140C|nr:DUF948 domain-containing protein [Sporosarcina sp. NCCP-2716]GKV68206.1 hypothetical protein NCCP2716_07040 [Sporosarcina sp. NCCP-2716]